MNFVSAILKRSALMTGAVNTRVSLKSGDIG